MVNTIESGSDFSIKLLLNGYKLPIYGNDEASTEEPVTSWDVAVSNSRSAFSFRQNKFRIKVGQYIQVLRFYKCLIEPLMQFAVQVKVWSSQTIADDNIRSLSLAKRKCMFEDEKLKMYNFSKVFKLYSKSACDLHCHIKLVEEKCGCIPWNYPQVRDILNKMDLIKYIIIRIR